ncbi:FixH family protein [Ascidiimonas aurantiaca]|uniref:FixH family protein n=1 Tax=Ascidiimonas aurantiaca TaxID=1685432 RepID=UPI0030EBC0F4
MKINWGTSIVIAFVLFIGFIMYFVIPMMTSEEYSHDLVTEQYYKKELDFQKEVDAEKKAIADNKTIQVKKVSEGLYVSFPSDLSPGKISGNIFLYRPSDKKMDFKVPLVLSDTNLLIPGKNLADGRWNITIQWEYMGESYMLKKQITY